MAPQRGKIEFLLEPINATSGASPEEPFNVQPGTQVGVIGRTIEGDTIIKKTLFNVLRFKYFAPIYPALTNTRLKYSLFSAEAYQEGGSR